MKLSELVTEAKSTNWTIESLKAALRKAVVELEDKFNPNCDVVVKADEICFDVMEGSSISSALKSLLPFTKKTYFDNTVRRGGFGNHEYHYYLNRLLTDDEVREVQETADTYRK